MRRSEFREKIIYLLYVFHIGGDFLLDDYTNELLKRYEDIIEKLEAIDKIISDNLVRYTIDRLNYVDKAIIENAVYEMVYTKLPPEISINEAINLTKKFTNLDDDSAKRFNNKLLDNIRKSLNK
ncbi:MAG: transcription antitermination factor NusB [Sphaerochaetaceae bacterium]|nr:transcription antitermination factor NusB [Sphaerochaetaceae bacterium]